MSELGPVSTAILEYVNLSPFHVEIFRMIDRVSRVTRARHTNEWYFRRLCALAFEGHIKVKIHRDGDGLAFKFIRLKD